MVVGMGRLVGEAELFTADDAERAEVFGLACEGPGWEIFEGSSSVFCSAFSADSAAISFVFF
jgi:hypothetical protein